MTCWARSASLCACIAVLASVVWSAPNAPATQKIEPGSPIPTVITVYADRSFTFEMKTPPASYLLKKAAKTKSGSKEPGRVVAGKVTQGQLREIAEAKMQDLNANSVEQAMKIIAGSARSMGLEVQE